jgi:secreted Zn-dependent insulinase-like peptidase
MKSECISSNFFLKEEEVLSHIIFKDQCKLKEQAREKASIYPHLVKRNIEGKVWWRIDTSFKVPAVFVGLRLDQPTS